MIGKGYISGRPPDALLPRTLWADINDSADESDGGSEDQEIYETNFNRGINNGA